MPTIQLAKSWNQRFTVYKHLTALNIRLAFRFFFSQNHHCKWGWWWWWWQQQQQHRYYCQFDFSLTLMVAVVSQSVSMGRDAILIKSLLRFGVPLIALFLTHSSIYKHRTGRGYKWILLCVATANMPTCSQNDRPTGRQAIIKIYHSHYKHHYGLNEIETKWLATDGNTLLSFRLKNPQ